MNLELSNELRESLSPQELLEFDAWVRNQHRADRLKDELAALTLADGMSRAERWFEQEKESEAAHMVATEIVAQWQSLRKVLIKNGLLG